MRDQLPVGLRPPSVACLLAGSTTGKQHDPACAVSYVQQCIQHTPHLCCYAHHAQRLQLMCWLHLSVSHPTHINTHNRNGPVSRRGACWDVQHDKQTHQHPTEAEATNKPRNPARWVDTELENSTAQGRRLVQIMRRMLTVCTERHMCACIPAVSTHPTDAHNQVAGAQPPTE